MAQVNIRIDDELKDRADVLFDELGLNMTTAFTIFVKAAVRQGGIPFEVSLDPFYSEANQAHLRRVIDEYESGKAPLITKTMKELEAMEDE